MTPCSLCKRAVIDIHRIASFGCDRGMRADLLLVDLRNEALSEQLMFEEKSLKA